MSKPTDKASHIEGFTLLEVAIAALILSLALAAIFGGAAVATKTSYSASFESIATHLARCKMGEIEESILREGFVDTPMKQQDQCCEGAEMEGFECEWSVDPVILPEDPEGDVDELDDADDIFDDEEEDPFEEESSIDEALEGDTSGLMSGIFQMVFSFLKPSIEAQIRRATVEVIWREGIGEDAATESFRVVQFIVADQGANLGETP